ncbi:signal peptidase I [Acetivibrio thermocellus]|uniref:signal peptidase I n=1 Tax=Acetivibrio thermocellus TaxID=1515 RepID=UPI0021AD6AC9|nr:signal peptidase I [Acetivibrio thermocellus]UWV47673.1 signal peptidase I [Acetivibrio thermocellus]
MWKVVQENYGSVLGCKTIEASLVYDNKMYYRLYTAYDADSKNLKLKVFKPGMLVNVIKQEQYNFTFRYYYGS